MHWRPMTTVRPARGAAIAAVVHPDFPEDDSVFAERQRLYPEWHAAARTGGAPAGYVLSHPWRFRALPALNSLLGAMPDDADTFYLHDLALLPKARGTGAAAMIVGDMLRHARSAGFATMSLVAVNGSLPFWHKHGFRAVKRARSWRPSCGATRQRHG